MDFLEVNFDEYVLIEGKETVVNIKSVKNSFSPLKHQQQTGYKNREHEKTPPKKLHTGKNPQVQSN
jgi:hypothetical protein